MTLELMVPQQQGCSSGKELLTLNFSNDTQNNPRGKVASSITIRAWVRLTLSLTASLHMEHNLSILGFGSLVGANPISRGLTKFREILIQHFE